MLSTSVVTDRITVTTKLHNFDNSPDEHVGNDILYLRDIILSNQIRLHDCVSILKKKKKPTTTKKKKMLPMIMKFHYLNLKETGSK